MQKITPFLWFDKQAEAAANFYVSIFPDSEILSINRYGEGGSKAPGNAKDSVMTVSFLLSGQKFVALNGGPAYKITPAVSFVVNCETQAEVDEMWEKLTAGGEEAQCGWLTDKFGVSWQVVPAGLGHMLSSSDPEQAKKVMLALLRMKKIDLAALQRAYAQ